MKPTPPSICVRVHHDVTREDLLPLLLGIEEEGVPVEVTRHEQLNPLTLAHEAAIESALGIGVGVALDYVVTTTEKLDEGRPYIAQFLGECPEQDRVIAGGNAARVVKRLPLRPFDASTPEFGD
jgi:hypothetical protein